MFCTRCGANNLDNDQFCRSCSAPLVRSGAVHERRPPSVQGHAPHSYPTPGPGQRHPSQNYPAPPPYPGYQGFSPQSGYAMGAPDWRALGADKKLVAGILGILIGALGIHKFVLGYKTEGLIMLLGTLLSCGVAAIVFGLIGLIEGILYLVKSDEEFVRTYIQNKKGWF